MTDLPSPELAELLGTLTPEIYTSLKRAVELGKWPNGIRLTRQQRELCLQAVIYYDGRNKPEHQRVGHIPREEHTHCGSEGDAQHDHSGNRWDEEQILVLRDMLHHTTTRH